MVLIFNSIFKQIGGQTPCDLAYRNDKNKIKSIRLNKDEKILK